MDDVDGFPMEKEANGSDKNPLIKSSAAISALQGYDDEDDEDLDGEPLDDDIDGAPLVESPKQGSTAPGFVPSKWESVSPKRVESQVF